MDEEKKLLSTEEADKLLACADGNVALLYLHILRTGKLSVTAASQVLKCKETDIALAADTLRRLGLLERVQAPLPNKEIPEYSANDITQRAKTDSAFSGVVSEAEHTLGRVLSSNDLRLLFGLYDHLGLPADVIMLLLHHCVEVYQERNGAGRMPTMHAIEKEGWFWAENEILNLDAAEQHILREKSSRDALNQVKQILQIRDRSMTATERRYVENWLNMGYAPESIEIAYDRTIAATNRLTWNYMDKIISNWNEKHLYTPKEIEEGDTRKKSYTSASTKSAPVSDTSKIDNMRRMFENMKGKSSGKES